MDAEPVDLGLREKVRELRRLLWYDPRLSASIVVLSLFTAAFEGIGLGFLLPIVQQASSGGGIQGSEEPILRYLATVYAAIGVPFTLRYLVYGLAVVVTIRYTMSFAVTWLRALLRLRFVSDMKSRLFASTLDTRIAHLDERGSEELLNAIVKQIDYGGDVIRTSVMFLEAILVSLVYLAISLYLAPVLTVLATVLLGGTMYLIRFVVKPAYATGDSLATANERLQTTAQAGIKGVREVKLFGMHDRLRSSFDQHLEQFVSADVNLRRNRSLLNNGFQLVSSFVVFGLIYFSITASVLSLGGIAVFLFAMFRLAPKINSLNNMAYHIDGHLPHVARTRETLQGLEREQETDRSETTRPITEPVTTLSFEDVSFTYADGTAALHDVSFHATSGEFVALVGPSGAGKSTIVSLLSRLREPGSGTIRANGTDIRTYELNSWRSRVAVVQQNPYLFNETLRFNLTLGRSYGRSELDRVCEIARVTEFLDDLPDGYETTLGDEGVRLSGGQRQRVAIARALLRDASVLVLDEATSDLDTALEADIHAAIESLDRDMITIAIAHRLSTIVDSDRIYVVEEGRIAERGDHGALLGKDGTYAELSQAQSGSQ